MSGPTDASPVLSEVDELLDDLVQSRSLAGRAFAAEMFFFARVAGLVDRREVERAARDRRGAVTHSTQLGMRELYAEVGAGLHMSEWQVARKVSLASVLTGMFSETLCAVSAGEISAEHATRIAEAGVSIADETVRAEFETVALDMAREMTPGQLKAALSGLVVRLDPEGTQERVRDAVERRKVTVRELEPGIARVAADVPTAQGVGAVDRLRQMAVEAFDQNTAGRREAEPVDSEPDERTVTQIMADMLCDLLLTAGLSGHGATDEARDALSAIRPSVQVTIPAATVTGARVGGAVVDGFGPIDDDTARRLAGNARAWTRVFTDPVHRSAGLRGPLPTVEAAEAVPASERSAVPIPRMPAPCTLVRHRPRDPACRRWADLPVQPGTSVQASSCGQARHGVAGGAAVRRRAALESADRSYPYHQAVRHGQVRPHRSDRVRPSRRARVCPRSRTLLSVATARDAVD